MKVKVFENIINVIAGLVLLLLLASSHSLADEDDKTLKVGIYDNSPLIFSTQDKQASGLFVDILGYISEQESWNIESVYASFLQHLRPFRFELRLRIQLEAKSGCRRC